MKIAFMLWRYILNFFYEAISIDFAFIKFLEHIIEIVVCFVSKLTIIT